ncbi:glycosyltransferase [Fluviicola sp.]|uniref:glycosyltransferase n=1 Tax=Fluviicola sp. TaxID=1917219 RepID=UPI0031E3BF44
MKILLLGMNYASTLNSLVSGFKESGQDVSAISFEENRSIYNSFENIHCVFPDQKLSWLAYKWKTLRGTRKLYSSVKQADVIHVYSNLTLPTKYEDKLLRFLFLKVAKHKKKFITYVGSEVRIPETDFPGNPFYKKAFQNPAYEYPYESQACSFKHQRKFSELGFELISTPDTLHYISDTFFKSGKMTFHAGAASTSFHKKENPEEIRVVHAPSAPVAKGSSIIRQAMENISARHPQVNYVELQQVSNERYQELVATCDLYIDQVIWGFHGVAAIQAMALGKPVVCYLHEIPLQYIPEDHPIINSNPSTLEATIEKFILNPQLFDDTGKKSIAYYENYHSPKAVAQRLLKTYAE